MNLVTIAPARNQVNDQTAREFPAADRPLGLYVHIPFCVRKCYYCDFNSGPASTAIREQYVDALIGEIEVSPWRGTEARTVFFGGGTPSELETAQLRRIAEALRTHFPATASGVSPNPDSPEWTIECNPGTVTEQTLAETRAMGFNRISFGVQSFWDHHLKALGRIHTAAEARDVIGRARRAGFRRMSLDLMFGLPRQTFEEWQSDVEAALALEPEHLSLYNLTLEEKTEFGRRHRLGQLTLPDEDLCADMYEWTIERMVAAGFVHYEVSNFARPGEECLHNRIYWRQEPSLGFGLSAASYLGGVRWANSGSMHRYLQTSRHADGPERLYEERLDPLTACGETIMLGLRTNEGLDLEEAAARYGLHAETVYGARVQQLCQDGLLEAEGSRIRLTHNGIMLANAVCAQFFPE